MFVTIYSRFVIRLDGLLELAQSNFHFIAPTLQKKKASSKGFHEPPKVKAGPGSWLPQCTAPAMRGCYASISDTRVSKHCTFVVLMTLTFLQVEPDPKSPIPSPQGPCLCAWGPG